MSPTPGSIKTGDLIALREAVQPRLFRGRIGRVLQVSDPDQLEVEFTTDSAEVIAKVQLTRKQVVVLHDEATLDETACWKLIEDAKAEAGGAIERQARLLVNALARSSIADIVAFGEWFDQFLSNAYRRELWAAAYVICDGCSDDGFMDFRMWLIGQGKKVYDDALRDPETLLDRIEVRNDNYGTYGDFSLGGIDSVVSDAYERKTGEPMPLFAGPYSPPKLTGEQWDEHTVYKKYPRLTAKFHPSHTAPSG